MIITSFWSAQPKAAEPSQYLILPKENRKMEEEMSVGRIVFRKNCENFSKNFTIYMLHKPFQKVDCMSKYNVRRFFFSYKL